MCVVKVKTPFKEFLSFLCTHHLSQEDYVFLVIDHLLQEKNLQDGSVRSSNTCGQVSVEGIACKGTARLGKGYCFVHSCCLTSVPFTDPDVYRSLSRPAALLLLSLRPRAGLYIAPQLAERAVLAFSSIVVYPR